jgi:hypothetical protein
VKASRRDLHGVVVEIDDRVDGRPTAQLFDAFPEAHSTSAPAIRLRLVPAAEPQALPSGRAVFFHGGVRAFEAAGRTLLWDGQSTVTVSADGRSVDAEVNEESLADPYAFSHTVLLMALLFALRHQGLFHLHAASLRATSGAGLLIAANGGSGKSTVALALASAGCDFMGDDTVLLARRGGQPRLLTLPRAFHLGEATANAFPALARFVGPVFTGTNKRFLDAEAAFGKAALREATAPAVILFPSIGSERATRIKPLPAAEALGRLIEASAFLTVDVAAGVGAQLDLLRILANGARGHRLELGRDLLQAPAEWAGWLLQAVGA